MKPTCLAANAVEQRRLGSGHPYLPATLEPSEQDRTARRVEVGGYLVEQQDRRSTAPRRYQFAMGKDETQQQRLLLAGRSACSGLGLCQVSNLQILPVRTFGRPACCSVAVAIGLEALRKISGLPSFKGKRSAREIVIGQAGDGLA
jgi:hypothetical protein